MLHFLTNLTSIYIYPVIFVGTIFLAGLMLIPAIYLAVAGYVNPFYVFATIMLSGICADSFWYWVGKHIRKERVYKLPLIRSKTQEIERFSNYFVRRMGLLVFICKFVYGARIASHILAGTYNMKYLKFVSIISAGTAIWFLAFYVLIRFLNMEMAEVRIIGLRVQIIFFISVAALFVANYLTGKYLKRRLLKNSGGKPGK